MLDLKDRLEKAKTENPRMKLLNGVCTFVLANETPPEWEVTVIEGGAKFFNSDGTDYTDGPKALNVPSASSYTFASADPSKCVLQIFLAINVSVPGEAPQTMVYQTEMAPEGECWISQGVTLGQANAVAEGELTSSRRMPLLTLKPS
jgi:hypothetical protein